MVTNINIFLIHYNNICFLSFVKLFSILQLFLAKGFSLAISYTALLPVKNISIIQLDPYSIVTKEKKRIYDW